MSNLTLQQYLNQRERTVINSLPVDMETELNMLKSYEKLRADMYKLADVKLNKRLMELRSFISQDQVNEIKKQYDAELLEGWSIEERDGLIKIVSPDLPARLYVKSTSSDIDFLNNKLAKNTARMLFKLDGFPFNWEKVFVWFKLYLPMKKCDIDNSFFKPVIDGLSKSGLIENDELSTMSFGFKGFYDTQNPRMEIYIFKNESVPDHRILFEFQ